jgi:hypothetical protein
LRERADWEKNETLEKKVFFSGEEIIIYILMIESDFYYLMMVQYHVYDVPIIAMYQ